MKYFYTDEARDDKIYVFVCSGEWINQLMLIKDRYYWISLNCCDINYNVDKSYKTKQQAIHYVMDFNDVYQLDTLEELAQFIKENSK
jgi:hypothetical protein